MQGPILTNDAVQDKMVDRLAYWDQVQDYFKSRGNGGWNPISLSRYRGFLKDGSGQQIAVVTASGLIVSGESANHANRRFRHGWRFGRSRYTQRAHRFEHSCHRAARGFRRRLGGGQRSDTPGSAVGS